MTEIISSSANPIGRSCPKSGLVADSPLAVTVIDARPRDSGQRVDPLPIQSRGAHAGVDDGVGRAIANLVLNADVEVPPDEQIVRAQFALGIRRDGIRVNDQHPEPPNTVVSRELLLLLFQCTGRRLGDFDGRRLSHHRALRHGAAST